MKLLVVLLVGLSWSMGFVYLYFWLTMQRRATHRMTCRRQILGLFVVFPMSDVFYIAPSLLAYPNQRIILVGIYLVLAAPELFVVRLAWRQHRSHDRDCRYGRAVEGAT